MSSTKTELQCPTARPLIWIMTFRGITMTGNASFPTIQRLLWFREADLNSSSSSLGCTPIRPGFLLHRHPCPGLLSPPSGPGSALVVAAAADELKPASPRRPRAASGAPALVSRGHAALRLIDNKALYTIKLADRLVAMFPLTPKDCSKSPRVSPPIFHMENSHVWTWLKGFDLWGGFLQGSLWKYIFKCHENTFHIDWPVKKEHYDWQ